MDLVKSGGRMCCPVRKHSGLRCAFAVFVLGLGATQACAQCVKQQRLTDSNEVASDTFGNSVSVNGDTALVGAPTDRCGAGSSCGAAYVFRFDGSSWVEEQKLTAPDAEERDWFGASVSLSGETAVVGARGDDCSAGEDCGSAYVFRFDGTTWVQEQKLTAFDAAEHALFGIAVSISGNAALVRGGGAAYVFRFNGARWVGEQKLTPSDGGVHGFSGGSGFLGADLALVGAPFVDCEAGHDCGAAYVYRFDGSSWVEEQKLTASDASANDLFGESVAVSGDTVLVGAIWDDCAAGGNCGAAYVFRLNGSSWVEQQKLTASDAGGVDFFGSSVSLSGKTALVGARRDDCLPSVDCGSAYLFRFNGSTWVEQQKLTASPAVPPAIFGASVSLNGETAFVGAPLDPCATGRFCGAVYVFSCPRVVDLDIKPGKCPNRVNPRSNRMVRVAILGDSDFDVATIDLDSLTLARTDGVGESVSPFLGRRGSGVAIKDVATPFEDELCACDDLGRDGIDDLTVTFSTADLTRALELDVLPRGEAIELGLRGTLQDGTTFEAVDCIVIQGPDFDETDLACPFEADTLWSSTQSLDQEIDIDEFPSFQQPERYAIVAGLRLDRAFMTLDIAGLESLWGGPITEDVTVVPLGERTQLYKVDDALGTPGLVGGGFLTITTFEIQCQGNEVTWTFDYEYSLEVFPANDPPTVARVTTISGQQIGTLSEEGSGIEWSDPVGTWSRNFVMLPLGDVVTPGTWSLESGALRLGGRGAKGNRSTLPVPGHSEPRRSTGHRPDRP